MADQEKRIHELTETTDKVDKFVALDEAGLPEALKYNVNNFVDKVQTDGLYVKLAGDETVNGVKTWNNQGIFNAGIDVTANGILVAIGTGNGITFGDGDTEIFESTDDTIGITAGGAFAWSISGVLRGANSTKVTLRGNVDATSVLPVLCPNGGDLDTGIGRQASDALSLIAGGVEGIRVQTTSIALNLPISSDVRFNGTIGIGVAPTTDQIYVNGNIRLTPDDQLRIVSTYTNYIEIYKGSNHRMEIVTGAGTSSNGGYEFWTAGTSLKFLIRGDGYIGVNTSSPSQRFEVQSGNILCDGGRYLTTPQEIYSDGGSGTRYETAPTASSNHLIVTFRTTGGHSTTNLYVDLDSYQTSSQMALFISVTFIPTSGGATQNLYFRNSSNQVIISITSTGIAAGVESHWGLILQYTSHTTTGTEWHVLGAPSRALV